jgi:PAS domain S-box-containing protein
MVSAGNPSALAAFRRTERVLDALPRAIVVTDAGGMIVGWNRVAETLFGWPADLVIGVHAADVVVPATDNPRRSQVLRSVLRGETWRGDFSVSRRDGTPVRVSAIVTPLRGDEREVVGAVAAADDVTDQRLAEQRSADLYQHLQLALEAGDLGTWRWNMTTGAVTWDERAERLFGLEPGEFDGTYDAWVGVLHPDDRDHVQDVVTAAVESKSSYQIDHRVVWRDGSIHGLQGRGNVTLDAAGAVTGTIGCVGDITASKAAEAVDRQRAADANTAAARERRQRERLEFLAGLSDASIRATDHREFMKSVTAAAVPRLGDWCSLHFIHEPGAKVELEVAHSDPAKVAWVKALAEKYPDDPNGQTGVAAVIRTGRVEYIPEVDESMIDRGLESSTIDRGEAQTILDALSLTSVITVPLITKREVIGAMQFVSAESGRRYDEQDVALARAAAGRIAAALENMWITDEHRHISVTLQSALLPPLVPRIPGLDVAVRYWPAGVASKVGGDFYDVFALAGDRWAVVIGDVCGTGADAAAVTSIVRHTIRAAARHGQGHAAVLEWINEAILHSDRDQFCTTSYATIEPVDGGHRLVCSSGGHPLPVIVRATGEVMTLGEPGTLLGAFDDIATSTEQTIVGPDDTVVFYTDGISDLPPPGGLDVEEVMALIAEAAAVSPRAADIADAIHCSLIDRVGDARRQDDVALVVLRGATRSGEPTTR